ncbi:c-type cytochrome [Indioceanicola profundi]|uniref:c-type cytochrome n=1 Tax=Indioceanicola profundi TaxID=2220096 RepID=UPI000E6AA531|nr:c-type cytochrome [Indioceanicola profundi]
MTRIAPVWSLLRSSATISFCLILLAGPVKADQTGEETFQQQCGACHSLDKQDGPRAGPPLHDLFGRKAGSVSGFEYSDALKQAGFAWDAAHLDKWLADSNEFLPGSYMNYRQEDADVRKGIIEYLRQSAKK